MDAGLVGRILLYAAIATSVWGAAASLLGKHRADARLAVSGRRGLYATTGLLIAATLWLVAALLRHDFSILYVAQVTSRSRHSKKTRSPSHWVTIVVPTLPQFGQTTAIGCHVSGCRTFATRR